MNARDVQLAALRARQGVAAAHQIGHEIFLSCLRIFGGEKHRRVTATDNYLRRTVSRSLSNLTLTRLFSGFDSTMRPSAVALKLANSPRPSSGRTKMTSTDLNHLRTRRGCYRATARRAAPPQPFPRLA